MAPHKPLSFFYRPVIDIYEPDLVVLHGQRETELRNMPLERRIEREV